MNLITFDNVIKDPKAYVSDIHTHEFQDVEDGSNTFRNIQSRDRYDEFAKYVTNLFDGYSVKLNFIRKSPLNQLEPNFIHTDEMMGDITCLLYLNDVEPKDNGTTIYDKDNKPLVTMYSKFNRMIAFNADAPYSRNILENFGEGEAARLVQIIFLKQL
jgi:hypothetical protein